MGRAKTTLIDEIEAGTGRREHANRKRNIARAKISLAHKTNPAVRAGFAFNSNDDRPAANINISRPLEPGLTS
jgi:hypothetical protein